MERRLSWWIVGVALAIVASGNAKASTSTGQLSIDVDAAQNVTVTGRADSLRAAVVDLCKRANVRLLAYDAEDRPFAAAYTKIPLAESLARLLRSEVYLAGVAPGDADSATKVTWLRVTGSAQGIVEIVAASPPVQASDAPQPLAKIDLGVPTQTVEAAIDSADPNARVGARRTVVLALRENRTALQRHLDDPTELLEALAPYEYAVELMQSVETVANDANERTLLRGITHSLRVRQQADGRILQHRVFGRQ